FMMSAMPRTISAPTSKHDDDDERATAVPAPPEIGIKRSCSSPPSTGLVLPNPTRRLGRWARSSANNESGAREIMLYYHKSPRKTNSKGGDCRGQHPLP